MLKKIFEIEKIFTFLQIHKTNFKIYLFTQKTNYNIFLKVLYLNYADVPKIEDLVKKTSEPPFIIQNRPHLEKNIFLMKRKKYYFFKMW
ncbi:hypothetical protein ['Camptotheca acuminata' phytoplasma]|uniref:hypothetical protein n=1 Tax='Camptotheca acuminata' phytoplasma TaxID=3239192 RepID=UPI00351A4AD0